MLEIVYRQFLLCVQVNARNQCVCLLDFFFISLANYINALIVESYYLWTRRFPLLIFLCHSRVGRIHWLRWVGRTVLWIVLFIICVGLHGWFWLSKTEVVQMRKKTLPTATTHTHTHKLIYIDVVNHLLTHSQFHETQQQKGNPIQIR